MFEFSSYPFMRPALMLACGIAIDLFRVPDGKTMPGFAWLSVTLILLLVSIIIRKSALTGLFRFAGFCALLAALLTGMWLSSLSRIQNSESFAFQPSMASAEWLEVHLDEDITEKQNSWRTECTVEKLAVGGKALSVKGRMLLYWPKSKTRHKPNLQFGDRIRIKAAVYQIPAAAFPDDFDFRAVMRYKNITHQAFLNANQWHLISHSPDGIKGYSMAARRWITARVKQLTDSVSSGMLVSLLAGSREYIDQSTIRDFSATGTMHVLAVSGMHTGILYALMVLIFTGKTREFRLRIGQSAFIIIVLWSFAFISGMSPSVIRAVFMFTVFEAGRSTFSGNGGLVNVLFASAFFQLLIFPLNLISPGFQLSYLAVLGIAVLYPHLSRLWTPANKVMKALHSSAWLSICATVATLPVTLYYFHSLPVWFIPANVLVVPLITILMCLGIALLIAGNLPFLGPLLIWFVKVLVLSILSVVKMFASLGKLSNLTWYVQLSDAVLLFLVIASISFALILWSRTWAWVAVSAAFAMTALNWSLKWYDFRHQTLIFCDLKNITFCALRDKHELFVFIPESGADRIGVLLPYFNSYCKYHQLERIRIEIPDESYHISGNRWMVQCRSGNLMMKTRGGSYLLPWNSIHNVDFNTARLEVNAKQLFSSTSPSPLTIQNSFRIVEF